MTKKEKAAKTRKAKQEAALKDLGFERKKVTKARKPRKPMSEEQRAAAAERLALARAKKKPAKNTNIHPDVAALPDDHMLSAKTVKEWVKYNKEKLSSIRSYKDDNYRHRRAEYQTLQTYIKNLNTYLSTGTWLDSRYGRDRANLMKYRIVARSKTSGNENFTAYGFVTEDSELPGQ
ncbi:MAG: hypothetical protein VW270_23430 [Candidatus Poseidoniales archaeon]